MNHRGDRHKYAYTASRMKVAEYEDPTWFKSDSPRYKCQGMCFGISTANQSNAIDDRLPHLISVIRPFALSTRTPETSTGTVHTTPVTFTARYSSLIYTVQRGINYRILQNQRGVSEAIVTATSSTRHR